MNYLNEEARAIRTMLEATKLSLKKEPDNDALLNRKRMLEEELEDRITRL